MAKFLRKPTPSRYFTVAFVPSPRYSAKPRSKLTILATRSVLRW